MRRAWLWMAVVLMLVAAGSYSLYLHFSPPPLPRQVLYGNGHVEDTEVTVSAEVPGRVVAVNFSECDTLEEGAVLVRIEDRELRLERDRTRTEISALEANRRRLAAELERWRYHLATAGKDLKRYRTLRGKGTVPPQRVEQAEDAFVDAERIAAGIEAQTNVTEAKLRAAPASLALTETRFGQTAIAAPSRGTVPVKAVEPGAFVQPDQALAVPADLRTVELKVFVPERDIGKIVLSAPFRGRVDAFPRTYYTGAAAAMAPARSSADRDVVPPEFPAAGHQFRWLRPLAVPKITPFLNEHGDVRTLDHFRGKVVLLNFWATWCAPCVEEMPSLDRLQGALGGEYFDVVPISIDSAHLLAVNPFYRRLGLSNLPIYLDPQGRTGYLDAENRKGAAFALYGLPITYLIDHRGRAVGFLPGPADWDSPAARRFLGHFIGRARDAGGGGTPPGP